MPKRTDLKKILIIGSGPIIISQACEFDYSGTQACKALKEEGYEVILINSNPATIMTDPETADRTYIEPITPEAVAKIIERERPDAILPTLGGQTGLNTAVGVAKLGVLEKYGVELIGASLEVIHKAEDREKFRDAMEKIGLRVPRSGFARNMDDVLKVADEIGFPIIIRPSFTLGGTGGGVAYNREDLLDIAKQGLDASMIGEIMLEESVLGWKEYELEVMRDRADNVVIICSIENFDAMGVHTGDSITVAPAQTLTDVEYQEMRNASIAIMREIGVETGGSNVQFAVNPKNGEMVVVEMNPRVSRSSALASKATGFPIAKIAAKLAVGYTLDEIPNDITRETMASFEPTIDYVVTKIPRWTFEKFPETEDLLTTSMKSVGETMAIGRTFKESLQKAVRSLEIGRFGLLQQLPPDIESAEEFLIPKLTTPNSQRLFYIATAIQCGMSIEDISRYTYIDPWFLHHIKEIVESENAFRVLSPSAETLREAKALGFSDRTPGAALEQDGAADPRSAHAAQGHTRLQARRHLRRRVRGLHALLLLDLRDRGRVTALDAKKGHHPRRRPQPDRPGHRVRLLLRPCLLRPARGRLREHHGELQPRDGLDGLRHLRQALLRAPDPRGRPPHPRYGKALRGDRPVRRPDAAQPGARPCRGRRSHPGHVLGSHRPRRGPGALSARSSASSSSTSPTTTT